MTTCPRCGRVADDEIVCADCGMSLALARRTVAVQTAHGVAPPSGLLDEFASEPESGESGRDVTLWRLAVIVCVTCVLAAATAIVLLNQHGSPHRHGVGLPLTSAPAHSPGASPTESSTAPATHASAHPSTSPAASRPKRTPSRPKTSPTTASPISRRSTSTSARGGPSPTVRAAKGAADPSCDPHCYRLVVTLSAFPAGAHHVTCWSGHGGAFASYTTTSTTSSECSYRQPHDTVQAIVDGTYRSNTVAW